MSDCAVSVMTDGVMLSYNHCWQTFKGHYMHELGGPAHCRTDFVYGGVCPVKWNANPQFYHLTDKGNLPIRFYSVPNK